MVTLTLPACGLAFLILYAVTGRVSAETCKIDGGYNYESLISSIWLTELEGKDCRYNTASPCSWILQFCNKVPLNPCGVNTACEVKEELKEPHPLGSFTQLLANGPNSFIAQFEGKYTGVPNCNNTKITTNVVFECDPNKHISVGNDTLVGKLVASKVVTDPKDQCMVWHLIRLLHSFVLRLGFGKHGLAIIELHCAGSPRTIAKPLCSVVLDGETNILVAWYYSRTPLHSLRVHGRKV